MNSPDARTRVVVADDHQVVRAGMRSLLEAIDFEVVGEAATGRDAVRIVLQTRPDLVVMDLKMPQLDGIAATAEITAAMPEVGVVVLTMFDDDDSLFAALRAGARGYVLKGAERDDVERALVSCARGDAVFGPAVAARVIRFFEQPVTATSGPFPELTNQELRILDLIARGTTNAAIAERLGIAPKTVRNHASSIFSKLHVANRSEAIVRARDEGLGRA
jgi:DNA-binding NarL/FixJ family response regulator